MALFGRHRDISLFRHLNRELIGDIVTQQCSFYKYKLNENSVNIYGETVGENYFMGPVLLNCRIERQEPGFQTTDIGTDFGWTVNFYLLRDDLLEKNKSFSEKYGANLVPEVGDIIMYHEQYFEVHNVKENQFFVGKDPAYPNQPNPFVDDLDEFGYSVSIICETHKIAGDKVGLEQRLIK